MLTYRRGSDASSKSISVVASQPGRRAFTGLAYTRALMCHRGKVDSWRVRSAHL